MTSIDLSLPSEFPLTFDVLVVGTGAAGLYTALCLPKHLSIGLVSQDILPLSASDWAQGGIAAATGNGDWERPRRNGHMRDLTFGQTGEP